jgi:hypothetical protein
MVFVWHAWCRTGRQGRQEHPLQQLCLAVMQLFCEGPHRSGVFSLTAASKQQGQGQSIYQQKDKLCCPRNDNLQQQLHRAQPSGPTRTESQKYYVHSPPQHVKKLQGTAMRGYQAGVSVPQPLDRVHRTVQTHTWQDVNGCSATGLC